MFEFCNLAEVTCAFCGNAYGVPHCGKGQQTKVKKSSTWITKISDMTECPRGFENKKEISKPLDKSYKVW